MVAGNDADFARPDRLGVRREFEVYVKVVLGGGFVHTARLP